MVMDIALACLCGALACLCGALAWIFNLCVAYCATSALAV